MRKYESELLGIIKKWAEDTSGDLDVFLAAESIVENNGQEYFLTFSREKTKHGWRRKHENLDDSWSLVPVTIIADLSAMQSSWICYEDIPAMRSLLEASKENIVQAWEAWDNYWDTMDWEQRRKLVAGRGWPYMFFKEEDKEFIKKFQR